MGKKTPVAPWQELEGQAYHAYREWPVWLMLRERELSMRIGSRHPKDGAPTSAPAGAQPVPKQEVNPSQEGENP
jgi:hypothetical protein